MVIGLLVMYFTRGNNNYINPKDIPNVSGIFKNLFDENGDKVNVIAIHTHMNTNEEKKAHTVCTACIAGNIHNMNTN